MRLVEAGFIETWRLKHWPSQTCDVTDHVIGSSAITLQHFTGHLTILACGIVLAFLVFVLEKLRHRFREYFRHVTSPAVMSSSTGTTAISCGFNATELGAICLPNVRARMRSSRVSATRNKQRHYHS